MGLFGKKVPVSFVFVGKYRAKTAMPERQYPALLKPMLPGIMQKQLGDEAANHPRFVWYFGEWSSHVYTSELIRDIEKNGFSAFNIAGDRQKMLDDINQTLIQRFGCTMDNYHPACMLFSDYPFAGLFVIYWTQKIKEKRLEG
mgnify:CR=1 FL=1